MADSRSIDPGIEVKIGAKPPIPYPTEEQDNPGKGPCLFYSFTISLMPALREEILSGSFTKTGSLYKKIKPYLPKEINDNAFKELILNFDYNFPKKDSESYKTLDLFADAFRKYVVALREDQITKSMIEAETKEQKEGETFADGLRRSLERNSSLYPEIITEIDYFYTGFNIKDPKAYFQLSDIRDEVYRDRNKVLMPVIEKCVKEFKKWSEKASNEKMRKEALYHYVTAKLFCPRKAEELTKILKKKPSDDATFHKILSFEINQLEHNSPFAKFNRDKERATHWGTNTDANTLASALDINLVIAKGGSVVAGHNIETKKDTSKWVVKLNNVHGMHWKTYVQSDEKIYQQYRRFENKRNFQTEIATVLNAMIPLTKDREEAKLAQQWLATLKSDRNKVIRESEDWIKKNPNQKSEFSHLLRYLILRNQQENLKVLSPEKDIAKTKAQDLLEKFIADETKVIAVQDLEAFYHHMKFLDDDEITIMLSSLNQRFPEEALSLILNLELDYQPLSLELSKLRNLLSDNAANSWKERLGQYEVKNALVTEKIDNILQNPDLAGELYNGCDNPSKTDARKAFIDKLNVLIKTLPAHSPKEKPIDMIKLLGEDGIELYKKALQEEFNSKEFRRQVLIESTKHYEGPKWKEKMVLWITGPAASGKSFARDSLVQQATKEMSCDPDDLSGNLVVSVDGGVERDVSTMRKLFLQVALGKGLEGIRDLESEKIHPKNNEDKKIKIKEYISKISEKSDSLNMVIPATCTTSINKKVKQYSKTDNIKQIFSRVKAGNSVEQDVRLRNTIKRQGDERAWLKIKRFILIKMFNQDPGCESKKYDWKGFFFGVVLSSRAEKNYKKCQAQAGKKATVFHNINDLMYAKKVGTTWKESNNPNDRPVIKLTERAFNHWKKNKKDLGDLASWWNSLPKDHAFKNSIVHDVSSAAPKAVSEKKETISQQTDVTMDMKHSSEPAPVILEKKENISEQPVAIDTKESSPTKVLSNTAEPLIDVARTTLTEKIKTSQPTEPQLSHPESNTKLELAPDEKVLNTVLKKGKGDVIGAFVEGVNKKNEYEITCTGMPKTIQGETEPSHDMLLYAKAQIDALQKAFHNPTPPVEVTITKHVVDECLIKAYILICNINNIKFDNQSALQYTPTEKQLNQAKHFLKNPQKNKKESSSTLRFFGALGRRHAEQHLNKFEIQKLLSEMNNCIIQLDPSQHTKTQSQSNLITNLNIKVKQIEGFKKQAEGIINNPDMNKTRKEEARNLLLEIDKLITKMDSLEVLREKNTHRIST